MLLAFGVALAAWLWVQARQVSTLQVRVDVDLLVSDDLVNTESSLGTVAAVVRGSLATARRTQLMHPTVLVDLRSAKDGVHDVPLEVAQLRDLPAGLAVLRFEPDRVRVRLEPRGTRNVEVDPDTVGDPDPRYAVAKVTVSPAVVEVTGPRAAVGALGRVRIRPVDLSGWTASREVPVELDLPRGVEPTQAWTGSAQVELQAVQTQLTLSDVPVVVRQRGWQAAEGDERITVTMEGPTAVLRALRVDQVIALVDLPEGAEASSYRARYGAPEPPRYEVIVPRADVVRVAEAPRPVEVVRR
ncbi:MAG TPA: CdaR family protein [Myxococcota bacterium]|nr:CdaR family protein [Myxococcota bacterium]